MTIRRPPCFFREASHHFMPNICRSFTSSPFSKAFFSGAFLGTAFGIYSNYNETFCHEQRNIAPLHLEQTPQIPTPSSLEDRYADHCFRDIDIKAQVNFTKFHAPNERHVLQIQPHLETAAPGVIVSTGTERSFFDLALSAISRGGENCTGLVVRDIDPQAIGYAHMITLMLRITNDVKDFEELSGPNRGPNLERLSKGQIDQKIKKIRERLSASDVPEKAKAFYLKHLDDFAPIYFRTQNTWRLSSKNEASQKYWQSHENNPLFASIPSKIRADSFQGVQYQQDETLFKTLQGFAKSGNIVCTVGSINDLTFINQDPLRLVDVSNIPDYIPMDLQCHEPCNPRFVWNNPEPPFAYTHYKSYDHDSTKDRLTPEQKKEFEQIRSQLHTARVVSGYLDRSVFPDSRPFGYYPESLSNIREYRDRWMIHHPRQGWVSFGPTYYRLLVNGVHPPLNEPIAGSNLKNKTVGELEELASMPETARFASHLVTLWPLLDTDQYLAFSKVPGWKEAFAKERQKQSKNIEFQSKFYNTEV